MESEEFKQFLLEKKRKEEEDAKWAQIKLESEAFQMKFHNWLDKNPKFEEFMNFVSQLSTFKRNGKVIWNVYRDRPARYVD